MPTKHTLPWLPLIIAVGVCVLVFPLCNGNDGCLLVPWLREERSLYQDLYTMCGALLLVLVVCICRSCYSGAVQVYKTRQALRQLAALPQAPLPTPLGALVRRLGIAQQVDVIDDDGIDVFCYGWLRPRILLTTELLKCLAVDEVEAVLRHELHHLRRRDALQTVLWTMLDAGCWWLPPASERARLNRELAADQAVIIVGQRLPLARALLKLLERGSQQHQTGLAVSNLGITEARIEQLLSQQQVTARPCLSLRYLVLPATLAMVALLCSLSVARF